MIGMQRTILRPSKIGGLVLLEKACIVLPYIVASQEMLAYVYNSFFQSSFKK